MNVQKVAVFSLLILIAFIARLPYLTWGLPNEIHPYSYHPDEAKQLDSIANMHPERLDLNPDEFIYPSLQYYVNAFALGVSYLIGYVRLIPDINFYIQNPVELAKLFLIGRFVTLLFSIGTILLVYLIGKRLYGEKAGLLAAFILALIPAFTIESHYMAVDVPLTFWITLTLFFSTYILKEDKWWPYILAGLSAGLATSTKYPGVFAWLLVLGAHALKMVNYSEEKKLENFYKYKGAVWMPLLFDKRLWVSGVLVILSFFLTSPFVFIDYQHSIPAITGQFELTKHSTFDNIGGNGIQYHKFTYLLLAAFPYAMGIPLYLLLLFSLFLQPDKKPLILLLSFILPFFLLFTTFQFVFIRYLLPFLPMFALIIGGTVERPNMSKYLRIAILVVMLATAFLLIGQNSKFKLDTRDEAYFWIKENVPTNSTLLVTEWAPLRYTPLRDSAAMAGREVNDSAIFKRRAENELEQKEDYYVLTLFDVLKAEDLILEYDPDYIVITSLDWSQYYRNQSQSKTIQDGLFFYKAIREGSVDFEKKKAMSLDEFRMMTHWKLIKSFDRTYWSEEIYIALDPRFKSSYASPRIEIYQRN